MLFSRPSATTAFVFAATVSKVLASIENVGLLPTPPMGFNNWARFECNLNERLFVETADAMAANGMLAAGYDRLNLDDCWLLHNRSATNELQWDPKLFPRGLIWLGQYFKSKGFHFGIYEDAGDLTCGGYPGSFGYEDIDAKTFASWGVDYLKLDGCNVNPFTAQEYKDIYEKWHDIFTSSDHPLIFSESAPAYFSQSTNNTDWFTVMDWIPSYGELARHSGDIATYGSSNAEGYWASIMNNYYENTLVSRYQAPGYYNDPDFIIADWPISLDERKSQFALWASFGAPLIVSADIPKLQKEELAYLTNKDIIAVDQDPNAQQATLAQQNADFDVLTRSLSNGDRLVTVLNKGDFAKSLDISFAKIGISADSVTAKDLWTGKSSTVSKKLHISNLNSHATAIYRLSGVGKTVPTGQIWNTLSNNCLTASGNLATFTKCAASNAQSWTVSPRGALSPLSAPNKCLTATTSGLRLQKCSPSNDHQHWQYHLSGNVISRGSFQCLTESSGLQSCAYEVDDQVFALPAGTHVVRP